MFLVRAREGDVTPAPAMMMERKYVRVHSYRGYTADLSNPDPRAGAWGVRLSNKDRGEHRIHTTQNVEHK